MNVQLDVPVPLFIPSATCVAGSRLTMFSQYCEAAVGRTIGDYRALERFSVGKSAAFWRLFLQWSAISWEGDADPACVGNSCEHAVFFPNLQLNHAECLLGGPDGPAVTACHNRDRYDRVSRQDLRAKAANLANFLYHLKVNPGDRVVAVARNNLEVIVAALAASAVGATFSSCSPEMGSFAMLARFAPLNNCRRAKLRDIASPRMGFL